MSRYHVTYKLPDYPALQVERFSSLSEAERRYDELAANADVQELSQPFDPEATTAESAPTSTSIHIEVTVEAPAISDGEEQ